MQRRGGAHSLVMTYSAALCTAHDAASAAGGVLVEEIDVVQCVCAGWSRMKSPV
jgi:hypothetical protein